MRILYGSLVLEDIRDYNVLVRMLTEGSTNQANLTFDQSSSLEGIGGESIFPTSATGGASGVIGLQNTRLNAIQSSNPITVNNQITGGSGSQGLITDWTDVGGGAGSLVAGNSIRRYAVQLASGLFQQSKLLPLKWMASQVAIEIELADYADCVCAEQPYVPASDSYTLQNLFMVLELLEFDQSYDQGNPTNLYKYITRQPNI